MNKSTVPGHLLLILIVCFIANGLRSQTFSVPYRDGNHWGLADTNGKLMVDCNYDTIINFYLRYREEAFYKVKKNGRLGIIDFNGNNILPIKYQRILAFEGLFRASRKIKNKWTDDIYDKTGKLLLKNLQSIRRFARRIKVKENNTLFIVKADINAGIYKISRTEVPFEGRWLVKFDSFGGKYEIQPDKNKYFSQTCYYYFKDGKRTDFYFDRYSEDYKPIYVKYDKVKDEKGHPIIARAITNDYERSKKYSEPKYYSIDYTKRRDGKIFKKCIPGSSNWHKENLLDSSLLLKPSKKLSFRIKEVELPNYMEPAFFHLKNGDRLFHKNYIEVYSNEQLIGIYLNDTFIPLKYARISKAFLLTKPRKNISEPCLGFIAETGDKFVHLIDYAGKGILADSFISIRRETPWFNALPFFIAEKESGYCLYNSKFKPITPESCDTIISLDYGFTFLKNQKYGYISYNEYSFLKPTFPYPVFDVKYLMTGKKEPFQVFQLTSVTGQILGFGDSKGILYFRNQPFQSKMPK